ncbi:hypothetical protein [Rhodococcus opacus]|uniref:hypothetical protein n=1 Tax=Rhodococcus opacus TaxID=37919 RepID=UPI000AD609E8|nr:hypothetical protein [Rhodococcus opacus]
MSGLGADPTASTISYLHGVDPSCTVAWYECEQCGRSLATHPHLLTGLGSDPGQQARVNPDMFGDVGAGGSTSTDFEAND